MEPDVPAAAVAGGRTIVSLKGRARCGYGHFAHLAPGAYPVRVSRICLVLSHGLALSRNFAAEVRYVHCVLSCSRACAGRGLSGRHRGLVAVATALTLVAG